MDILNFGSLNIDHVYRMERFVRPGETVSSLSYERFCGGKGLNQSIALARAGASVFHAGKIGPEGGLLKVALAENEVDIRFVETCETPTGHAVIQVDAAGENAIFLFGGANRMVTAKDAERALEDFKAGDMLLVQNEISAVGEIVALAAAREMVVAMNPAPMNADVLTYPLDKVNYFFLNETEAMGLSGESAPDRALAALTSRYPAARIVLTLGSRGALCAWDGQTAEARAPKVEAVDATGAGDTFIGYYLAAVSSGRAEAEALDLACRAAALSVTRKGASSSIPWLDEAEAFSL